MDKINSTAKLDFKVTIELSEQEVRALKVFTGWGADSFINVFCEKLGKQDILKNEAGVRSLFETINKELPKHISRFDRTRKAFLDDEK